MLRQGNCKIEVYDPDKDAAFYVTKLIENPDTMFLDRNMQLLDYHGPMDLLDAAKNNPYVPDHLNDKLFGEYLVTRPFPEAV